MRPIRPTESLLFALINPSVHTDADIILWRDRKASASILAAATAAWGLFEVAEYHLLTVVCYVAMIGMLLIFIWTNASTFFNL